jgi:hypothetical protein
MSKLKITFFTFLLTFGSAAVADATLSDTNCDRTPLKESAEFFKLVLGDLKDGDDSYPVESIQYFVNAKTKWIRVKIRRDNKSSATMNYSFFRNQDCSLSVERVTVEDPFVNKNRKKDFQVSLLPSMAKAPENKIGNFNISVYEVFDRQFKRLIFKSDKVEFGDCKQCSRGVSLKGGIFKNGLGIRFEGDSTKNLGINVKNQSPFKLTANPQLENNDAKDYEFSQNEFTSTITDKGFPRYELKIVFQEAEK